MKYKLNFLRILTFLALSIPFNTFAQAPAIQWQQTIGANSSEFLDDMLQTTDGGYILGGSSISGINGDKTAPNRGDYDFWVIKIDAVGNIQWQQTYGGNGSDYFASIVIANDGGYLLCGYSTSGISGNKSAPNYGASDYWVIKIDADGNEEWQKSFGGLEEDILHASIATGDDGFLLGGYSESNASGNKTDNVHGLANSPDFWVIKLDALGAILWQHSIGGISEEKLFSLDLTDDNGFLLAGTSYSNISGDKTENSNGSYDFWIVKLNASGLIEWDKGIGGSALDWLMDAEQTADGGYILGGYSNSPVSGDKTKNCLAGSNDYWIVKLNATANIVWQRSYRGHYYDQLTTIHQTSDGGYICSGDSDSGISGEKTEATEGGTDYWVLKLDNIGLIEWQSDLGGNFYDHSEHAFETSDGGYMIAGYSPSPISGDKTEVCLGSNDYWIIKLEGNCINAPEVCNTIDDNCNGIVDDGIIETISIEADGSTTFCQGVTVLLSALYSGVTVQWLKNGIPVPGATSPNYIANKTGIYTAVTTSECGSATSAAISVTVNKNPAANITAAGPTTFCTGGSVSLNVNPVASCTYQWYKGATPIAGATSLTYTATTSGNYKCRVTKAATGCFKNSNVIAVSVTCKEGELFPEQYSQSLNLEIVPNPNNGAFNIIVNGFADNNNFATPENSQIYNVVIYNTLNQLVYSKQIISNNGNLIETILLDNLTSGIYFINLTSGNSFSQQKLIIQN